MNPWYESDRRVPRFRIHIEPVGGPLDNETRQYLLLNLEQLFTEDSALLDKASNARITYNDPELRLIGQISKYRNAKVQIWGGWTVPTSLWFDGVVNNFEPNFDKIPQISLLCADYSTLLVGTSERIEENVSDSDIVKKILQEYGLSPEVTDTSTKNPSLTKPQGIRDIDFIIELARRNPGFTFYIDPETGKAYFGKKPLDTSSSRVLHYRTPPFDLIRFFPMFKGVMPGSIEMNDVDLESGEVATGKAEASEIPSTGKEPYSKDVEIWVDTPEQWKQKSIVQGGSSPPSRTKDQLINLAQAALTELSFNLTGTGQCLPDPNFKANQLAVLKGLGEELSGTWYITTVRNRITRREGWTQEFDAQKNAPAYVAADENLANEDTSEETPRRRAMIFDDTSKLFREKEVRP